MDFGKQGKGKKNLLLKTWERCRSLPKTTREKSPSKPLSKSKSWHSIFTGLTREFKRGDKAKSRQVAPDGCFSVYVGPERQRFVIKTEHANHPLFQLLLEDAEREYGYNSEGPLLIPCDVDLFYKVLAEMESREVVVPSCGFAYSPFNSNRRLGSGDMAKVGGSYGVLSSSPLLKINQF
ncbi:auxin-responsive protein SAUR32-like [Actinidia eriantha]|uniref:auxin-responsive protein SAUR32-like n=1 Tax=Actinidia eriantha TaxID=165200 RepID=UPI002583AC16|nr:auxin-responsive protein SAUR32-like [Actinidia eriantha]